MGDSKMRKSITVPVTDKYIKEIRNSSTTNELLKIISKYVSSEDLVSLLIQYDYYHEVRGEIHAASIRDCKINKNGNGFMWIVFDVFYYHGCRDIDERDEDDMKVDIQYDSIKYELLLTGEKENKREVDSY